MESISVILPAFDDSHNLKKQINCLNEQTLLPNEIIIVDSSSDNKVQDLVKLIPSTVQIKYFRIGRGFKFDRYLLYLSRLLFFLKKKYDFNIDSFNDPKVDFEKDFIDIKNDFYDLIIYFCAIKIVRVSPPAPFSPKINHDNTCAANLCLLTKA